MLKEFVKNVECSSFFTMLVYVFLKMLNNLFFPNVKLFFKKMLNLIWALTSFIDR